MKQYDKLEWVLLFLLSKPHGASFDDIKEQWAKNNEEMVLRGKTLQYRTFYNWCQELKAKGLYSIECDRKENLYYLKPTENSAGDKLTSNIIEDSITDYGKIRRALDNREIQDRIVKDPVFESEEALDAITTAIRQGKVLHICYEKFGGESYEMDVHPYALRLCERRWYLLAYSPERKGMRIYALDRLPCCDIVNESFSLPEGFCAYDYFRDCIGVYFGTTAEERQPATVILKTSHRQGEYLQTLPLHHSQQMVMESDEYALFTYRLLPTDELVTRILAMGAEAEILEPVSLRDKIKARIEQLRTMYG